MASYTNTAPLDLLNTTLQDLQGPLEHSFTHFNPLMDLLFAKKQVKYGGGIYIEKPFAYGGAGQFVAVRTGSEKLAKARRQNTAKLRVEQARIVGTVHIPNIDMIKNSGKQAAVDLTRDYVVRDLELLQQDLNKYFLTSYTEDGVVSRDQLFSFLTLNGEFSSGIGEGVTNGVLSFLPPASQSTDVENVQKSEAQKHYNQYGEIGTFASNGVFKLKQQLRKAAYFAGGSRPSNSNYIILMDDTTFGNMEQVYGGPVRTTMVNDARERELLIGLPLNGAVVNYEPAIDVTKFSGTGANGVTYMINGDFVEFHMAEKMSFGKWQEAEEQDVVYSKCPFMGNFFFTRLPAHAVVAGGNS